MLFTVQSTECNQTSIGMKGFSFIYSRLGDMGKGDVVSGPVSRVTGEKLGCLCE